jgi:16S rRNA (cytosine1402-N4)-methyltransferase
MNDRGHIPVLLKEVLEFLDTSRGGVYVDCTLGLAGHGRAILESNPRASLIGLDVDETSLLEAGQNLAPFAKRVRLFHSDFRNLPDLDVDFSAVRGVLLDLGISSFQLDSPGRGFSFSQDGPLDMRMDFRNKTTALKIIERSSEARLAEIFRDFGELRQARQLARAIVSRRKVRRIETTTELCRMIEEVCRWRPQKGRIHPAAKAFQALRIEVNQELAGLSDFLKTVAERVTAGARIVAIAFHSLEDRIVKHTFQDLAGEEGRSILRILTKKPVMASDEEVARNSRSRSAKLRAAERI